MPNLMQPYEIIATPFEVYVTTGTDSFPLVTATPTGGWTKLGVNGVDNQKEGGVTVQHNQTFLTVRTEGHTGPVKVSRLTEDHIVSLTLYDLTQNVYKFAMNSDVPTAQGSTGYDIGMSRGVDVRELKVLVRGVSPLAVSKNAQYEIPRCYQSGQSSVQLTKTAPAGLTLEFTALDDLSSLTTGQRFGKLVIAT